jgi:hypothetical protein
MSRTIPERDWKLLGQLKPTLVNRFTQRILSDVANISNGTGSAHERYCTIFQLLHKEDKKLAGAFDNLRRSSALLQMAHMHHLELLTDEEFALFSEETRAAVRALASM